MQMKNKLLLLTFIALINSGAVAAAEFTLPFALTIMPNARLAISEVYDTPSGDREESIARYATKASREEVITFYKKALKEAGFQTYSASDKPKYYMFAAKRNNDRITVYFKNQSDWVEAGESEISIKGIYDK